MKKTAIYLAALSTLVVGAAAHAQSSVTLYGRINTSAEYQKISGNKSTTKLESNGSFIGFKGTEDLGNGLKAGFVLEQTVNSTDGASPDGFGRESQVNLSGSFGTIKAGNYNSTAYSQTADWISMFNHDTGVTADQLYAYIVPNTSKIGYISPEFAGFQAEVGFGFKDNHPQEDGKKKSPYDLSVVYNNGGLGLAFAYAKWDKADAYTVRALYNTGPWTVGGYVQYDKGHSSVAAPYLAADQYGLNLNSLAQEHQDFGKRTTLRLVGAYAFGASELHANVGWADNYKKLKDNGIRTEAIQYTLGYNYNLSKRTKVYGFYTGIDAKELPDVHTLGVGIRHLF